MLINYLTIALRNLYKQKITTLINIVGLSIGLTCCILVLLYVQYEISFDSFHTNKDNIYQIVWGHKDNYGNDLKYSKSIPVPFYEGVKSIFPEIINATKISGPGQMNIVYETKEITNKQVIYADSSFLDMFSFTLLTGDKRTALNSPDKVILTHKLAQVLFGNENPIGRTIILNQMPFVVSAELKDIPANSTLQFSAILPIKANATISLITSDWSIWIISGYIQLPPNYPPNILSSKLNHFIDTHLRTNMGEYNSVSLQPFSRMHLYSSKDYGIKEDGSIARVIIFSLAAILTLILACINFINISLSLMSGRYKEVGLRKIIGASKKQIFIQFIFEILIICSISIIISTLMVYILLPKFNFFVDKNIIFNIFDSNILIILIVLIFSCFLAGSYPAIIASKFNPIEILRNKLKFGRKNMCTTILLTLQFTLSIFFFIAMSVMSKQLSYLFSKYNKDDKATIVEIYSNSGGASEDINISNVKYFKNELTKDRRISNITFLYNDIGSIKDITCEGKEVNGEIFPVDLNYFATYGINALEGQTFNRNSIFSDTMDAVVVNQSFVRSNDMHSPLGKFIRVQQVFNPEILRDMNLHNINRNYDRQYKIIGVVEDFTRNKLTKNYAPEIYFATDNVTNMISLKVQNDNFVSIMDDIKNIYAASFPGTKFNYKFFNESIRRMYTEELKERDLLQYVSIFVLLITVFGVFGFTVLNISKRLKEIGIRKSLGASTIDIIILLVREYMLLVLIAFILAAPTAYYVINKWMDNFIVKAPVSVWYFINIGLLVSCIIILSIGIQVIKAAHSNPVELIRYE